MTASTVSVPALPHPLAEALPHHVWTADPNGKFEYFNQRALEFYETTLDGLRAIDWTAVIHPDDLAVALAGWRASVASGEPYEAEYRMLDRRAREYRWFHARAVAQRGPGGAVERWFGTSTDIERQKRAEYATRFLATAGAVLGTTLDVERTLADVARLAVPHVADWCAVDLLDDRGGFRRVAVAHVDPAKVSLAHELWARSPPGVDDPHGVAAVVRTGEPELLADIPDELLVAATPDPEILATLRALGLRSSVTVPLTALGKTIGALSLVSAESGRRYGPDEVALAAEIGQRAAMAIENARLYAETRALLRERDEMLQTLEQRVAERTARLTEANLELEAFTYTVSHDLRAPIRHVSGFVDLLSRNAAGRLDDTGQRYLRTIGTAARQMGTLIDALLAFSRLGRSEIARAPVDLGDVVREALRELEPDTNGRVLDVRVGELPRVSGDPTTLKLALANLLGNAIKYTRTRAEARVEVGARPGPGDGEVTVFVRDNGVGFDPRYGHKLFGVFQRLHSEQEFEGTGIGLASVRRIVQRHGGRVSAEGAPDRGATFSITLPSG